MASSAMSIGNSAGPASGPVFVVGSPRSGTSILTWCLGQHSNLLPLEESVWMGDFATDVGARYLAGSRRGERSQLGAMGLARDTFFADIGAAIDRMILAHRAAWETACTRSAERTGSNPLDAAFRLRRDADDLKSRWVDGTPEYSLHICGLRKLFPAAKFVHVVRHVDEVVKSMLNFHRLSGHALVADSSAAYEYWYRTVSACMLAERAWGKQIVHRVRYADLTERPEHTLTEILNFLGETFQPCCLEPLIERINSSSVPADFDIDIAGVDPRLLQRALDLSRSLQTPLPGCEPVESALTQLESLFDARVGHVAGLEEEYANAQQVVTRLHGELDERTLWAHQLDTELASKRVRIAELQREVGECTQWALHLNRILAGFGALLTLQFMILVIAALAVRSSSTWFRSSLGYFCFALSALGACAYLWMRRGDVRRFASCSVGRLMSRR